MVACFGGVCLFWVLLGVLVALFFFFIGWLVLLFGEGLGVGGREGRRRKEQGRQQHDMMTQQGSVFED